MDCSPKRNKWHQGSVRQRADGRFEGRVTIHGKTKYIYGKSEYECKRKLKVYIRECLDDVSDIYKISLHKYSLEYLKSKRYIIERSTFDRLENIINSQIKNSEVGGKPLVSIKPRDLQEFLNILAFGSMECFSYSTIKTIYTFINGIFNYAIKNSDIESNPMLIVRLPKESFCKIKKKETFSLSPDQINKFKEACLQKNRTNDSYKYRYGLTLLLLLNTGMRIGEAIALEWNDIDFLNNIIKINKSMQYNVKVDGEEKRQSFIKSPKTKKSNRIIPINDEIRYSLDEMINSNKENNIESEIVCCSETGGYALARSIQRSLDMIVNGTELPHLWIHLLRHTFGSELIRRGVEISIVSRLMGHSNTTTTYNTYVHVLEEEAAKAMNMISISG